MSQETELDDFKLGKPPIIEAWIRATFHPTDAPDAWEWTGTFEFLESFAPELDTIESLPEPPRVERVKKKGKRHQELQFTLEPRYFRVRNADRSKIVQVGKTDLLVSRMRTDAAAYPGFTEVLRSFEEILKRFTQSIGARAINTIELHYVDLIQIPLPADGRITLSDYFQGMGEPKSSPFGETWQLSWSANLIPPDSSDTAQIAFQTMPAEDQSVRFRVDWHRTTRMTPSSEHSVRSQLTAAHKYLKSCFHSFCLPRTWELFEPSRKSQT